MLVERKVARNPLLNIAETVRKQLNGMKKILYILYILLIPISSVYAQSLEKSWLFSQKNWPNTAIYPYELKGQVKSWEMKGRYGIVRRQEFDKLGNLVLDNCKNKVTVIENNSPDALIKNYEKSYIAFDTINNSIYLKLNNRGQVLEKGDGKTRTFNTFDANGKILMSQTRTFKSRVYTADSRGDFNTPYVYRDTTYSITLFEYNQLGSLITFAYFNRSGSNDDNSIGIIYKRDSADNVIQEMKYNSHAILSRCFGDFHSSSDDYLKKVITKIKDSSFTVNDIFSKCLVIDKYKHYWNSTYKYDTSGNCVEYIYYGYRPLHGGDQQTLRATWEFTDGILTKELQYDGDNRLKATLEYDDNKNVIKEIIIWGDQEVVFDYEIDYYE